MAALYMILRFRSISFSLTYIYITNPRIIDISKMSCSIGLRVNPIGATGGGDKAPPGAGGDEWIWWKWMFAKSGKPVLKLVSFESDHASHGGCAISWYILNNYDKSHIQHPSFGNSVIFYLLLYLKLWQTSTFENEANRYQNVRVGDLPWAQRA